jgi:hypothetical protein
MTPAQESLHFDPDTHTYTLYGRVVPSVTQILKGAGLIDASQHSEAAASKGTSIHLACEYEDQNDLADESVTPYVLAYQRFKRESGVKILELEKVVYHDLYNYAGRVDRVVAFPDGNGGFARPAALDIKSGSPAHWHHIQVAAYSMALGFTGTAERHVLYLRDDGTYKLDSSHSAVYNDVFRAALTLYSWKKSNGTL